MNIWILTMFPDFFKAFKENGVIGQTIRGERVKNLSIEVKTVRISDFCEKGFKGVDQSPYGGGAGVVMRADALRDAFLKGIVDAGAYGKEWQDKLHVIYPGPRGSVWCDSLARESARKWFNKEKDLVFICGRYEGIDERFLELYVDEHISIGDFILSGGELATMTILDSSMRFVSGVLGNLESGIEESFADGLLEQPQYTRPAFFEGESVPNELVSGNHKEIEKFRLKQREMMTKKYRQDLWENYQKRKNS